MIRKIKKINTTHQLVGFSLLHPFLTVGSCQKSKSLIFRVADGDRWRPYSLQRVLIVVRTRMVSSAPVTGWWWLSVSKPPNPFFFPFFLGLLFHIMRQTLPYIRSARRCCPGFLRFYMNCESSSTQRNTPRKGHLTSYLTQGGDDDDDDVEFQILWTSAQQRDTERECLYKHTSPSI